MNKLTYMARKAAQALYQHEAPTGKMQAGVANKIQDLFTTPGLGLNDLIQRGDRQAAFRGMGRGIASVAGGAKPPTAELLRQGAGAVKNYDYGGLVNELLFSNREN
jgi:hypothetical protein